MTRAPAPDPLAPLREALAAVFEPGRIEKELLGCEAEIIAAKPELLKRIVAGEEQAGLQLRMNKFREEALPAERETIAEEKASARTALLRIENETVKAWRATACQLQVRKCMEVAEVVKPVVAPLLADGACPDFGSLGRYTNDYGRATTLLYELDVLEKDYTSDMLREIHPSLEHNYLIRKARRLIKAGEHFFLGK